MNEIILGDCIEEMAKMTAESIDMIMTSPPYFNANKKYQRGSGVHYSIDFGEPLYIIEDMFKEAIKVLKKTGFFALNLGFSYADTGIMQPFRIIERALKLGFFARDLIIWKKKNPIPLQNRLTNCIEYLFILAKHPLTPYPNAETMGYKLNFIETSINKPEEANFHNAVYPEEMCSYIIEIFSKEGDLILDPFIGSGTTALSALSLNRNYIGIEINKEYVEKAQERIKKYTKKDLTICYRCLGLRAENYDGKYQIGETIYYLCPICYAESLKLFGMKNPLNWLNGYRSNQD